jgi:hypothetical protein
MNDDARSAALEAAHLSDIAVWDAVLTVAKYHGDEAFDSEAIPYEVTEPTHNMLMTAGVNQLLTIVTGQGGTVFSAGNTYIGVGDATTTAAATQTDLLAATNKLRKQITAAPAVSSNTVTFSTTFGTSDGNFAWNEVGIFNSSSAGTMLNRFVVSLGTKSSSASWTINVVVTIA